MGNPIITPNHSEPFKAIGKGLRNGAFARVSRGDGHLIYEATSDK